MSDSAAKADSLENLLDFDADVALAEVRAHEAMEVLRNREHGEMVLRNNVGMAPLGPHLDPSSRPTATWEEEEPPAPIGEDGDEGPTDVPELAPPKASDALDDIVLIEELDEGPSKVASQIAVDPSDPRFETVADPRIPQSQDSFRIGEAADIVGVRPHVLRFWETEFAWIAPDKTESNQRRYRREDLSVLLQIKRLRHDRQLSVSQTRAAIEAHRNGQGEASAYRWFSHEMKAEQLLSGLTPKDEVRLREQLETMRHTITELLEAVEGDRVHRQSER